MRRVIALSLAFIFAFSGTAFSKLSAAEANKKEINLDSGFYFGTKYYTFWGEEQKPSGFLMAFTSRMRGKPQEKQLRYAWKVNDKLVNSSFIESRDFVMFSGKQADKLVDPSDHKVSLIVGDPKSSNVSSATEKVFRIDSKEIEGFDTNFDFKMHYNTLNSRKINFKLVSKNKSPDLIYLWKFIQKGQSEEKTWFGAREESEGMYEQVFDLNNGRMVYAVLMLMDPDSNLVVRRVKLIDLADGGFVSPADLKNKTAKVE